MSSFYLLVLFLLVTAAAIAWMTPVKPDDQNTVRFELARSVDEARPLLGELDGVQWKRMRATFQRDFLFILGYAGFFAAVGLGVQRLSPWLGWVIVALALAVGLFDVLENVNGLAVLSHALGDDSVSALRRMSSWSRLKWLTLGPLCLGIAWADLAQRAPVWSVLAAALFCLAGIAFCASLAAPSVLYSRWLATLLFLAMVAQVVLAYKQRR